ncbi:unnamed protein product [Arctogadus glacialis]
MFLRNVVDAKKSRGKVSGETLDVDAVSLRFPVRRQEWPSVRLSTKETRTICKDFGRTLTGDLLRALLDR